MVSTKRTEEGRSATPTTDKKKRRTSIEPENLSVAEQRQRAKEWAEKEKQKVADGAATADVVEKKVKRATKAKKEVEDVVEESTTEVVKVTRKSFRKPANAEEEEQVAVPSSPVIVKKPTRAKRTSISVPPVVEPVETSFVPSPIRTVEQQQIVSSPAKSPVMSPVKSTLQQQQPTSALKTRTPRKQVSNSVAASPYLPVKTDDNEVAAAFQQTNKANAQTTISSSSTDNSAQVESDSDIKVVRVVNEASSFEASPGLIAVFVLLVAWAAFVIKYIENLSVVLAVAVVGALVVSTVRRWSVFMCCGSKRKDGSHYYLTSAANNNQFMEE